MSLYSYIIVLYVAFLLSIYFVRDIKSDLIYIQTLLLITVIIESIGFFYLKHYNKAAILPYLIYQPLEYLLIAWYFQRIISSTKTIKIIRFSIPMAISIYFVLYFVSDLLNFSKYSGFLFITISISLISLLYFNQLLNEQLDKKLRCNPHFFIATGILLFHTCSFMVMGLVNNIYSRNPELARKVFSINHILNIIYYGLITYAFYIQWKSTKSSLSS